EATVTARPHIRATLSTRFITGVLETVVTGGRAPERPEPPRRKRPLPAAAWREWRPGRGRWPPDWRPRPRRWPKWRGRRGGSPPAAYRDRSSATREPHGPGRPVRAAGGPWPGPRARRRCRAACRRSGAPVGPRRRRGTPHPWRPRRP